MQTLISVAHLKALLGGPQAVVVLDCGFDLTDSSAGERAYLAGHLPGAQYAHLERDLSGPKASAGEASRGRHPLPGRSALAAAAGRWGIAPGVQVVAYDAQGGPYAARAWWLLNWLGHAEVAVLDGGTAAWLAGGGVLDAQPPAAQAKPDYPAFAAAMPTLDAAALQSRLGATSGLGLDSVRLVDARAPERFRGDVEPLDPVAGHIPGALNRFFKLNLQADGRFKPAGDLHAEWAALMQSNPGQAVVQQCGSGVTACHNLLAMAHAGLGVATLYPGSWSEWSSDPMRPMARG